MRKYLVGLALLGGMALVALPINAQKLQLPPVKRQREANGIRLVLMEYPRVPSITLRALFPGGKTHAPQNKAGVAELVATLLRRGTHRSRTHRSASQAKQS